MTPDPLSHAERLRQMAAFLEHLIEAAEHFNGPQPHWHSERCAEQAAELAGAAALDEAAPLRAELDAPVEVAGAYVLGGNRITATTGGELLSAVLEKLRASPIGEVQIGPVGWADHAESEHAALRARVAQLEQAGAALVAKMDEVAPHIASAFVMSVIHGARYDGPNYAEELTALRAALTPEAP